MVAAVVALMVVLAGCRYQFSSDQSITIVQPENRSTVELPLTLRWSAHLPAGATSFLVVIDRAPQPPGTDVSHFVKDISSCKGLGRTSCLSADYLAGLGVYPVSKPELIVGVVPDRSAVRKDERNGHEATVVLLDQSGKRVGEQSWTVRFKTPESDL
jgi:hypothetical protein